MFASIAQRLQSKFGLSLASASDWAMSAAILVGAAIVALLLYAVALALARRLITERRPFLRTALSATKGPIRLALLLLALAVALPAMPLAEATTNLLARLLGVATICLLGWIALTAL